MKTHLNDLIDLPMKTLPLRVRASEWCVQWKEWPAGWGWSPVGLYSGKTQFPIAIHAYFRHAGAI